MSDLFSATERLTPSPVRQKPESWSNVLGKVPEYFRETLLQCAWKTHDRTLAATEMDESRTRGHEHITAISTAQADISAIVFMPLHLIKPDDHAKALQVLSGGVAELSNWIQLTYPGADTVLIVGDQPNAETLNDHLDELFDALPAKRLVCGPGASVEALVRAYAEKHDFGAAQIGSIDEHKGLGWIQTPGAKLDKMVADLFRQFNPNRVVAFEPLQMPSTHKAMEKAAELGLLVQRVEAPSIRSRLKP